MTHTHTYPLNREIITQIRKARSITVHAERSYAVLSLQFGSPASPESYVIRYDLPRESVRVTCYGIRDSRPLANLSHYASADFYGNDSRERDWRHRLKASDLLSFEMVGSNDSETLRDAGLTHDQAFVKVWRKVRNRVTFERHLLDERITPRDSPARIVRVPVGAYSHAA